MKPSKSKIQLWNRLVKEVFNHPKSGYSLFVYELCRRRILGTTKKEFREIGHDFGIKDIEGYFDWDEDNSQQKSRIATDKSSRALLDNVSEGSRPKRPQQLEEGSADKLKSGDAQNE